MMVRRLVRRVLLTALDSPTAASRSLDCDAAKIGSLFRHPPPEPARCGRFPCQPVQHRRLGQSLPRSRAARWFLGLPLRYRPRAHATGRRHTTGASDRSGKPDSQEEPPTSGTGSVPAGPIGVDRCRQAAPGCLASRIGRTLAYVLALPRFPPPQRPIRGFSASPPDNSPSNSLASRRSSSSLIWEASVGCPLAWRVGPGGGPTSRRCPQTSCAARWRAGRP